MRAWKVLIRALTDFRKSIDIMVTDGSPVNILEIEFLGCTRELAGAYLMSIWGPLASIVQAVQFHPSPSRIPAIAFSPLAAVHCADAIASEPDKWQMNRDLKLDTTHLDSLGMSDNAAVWRHPYQEYLEATRDKSPESHNLFFKEMAAWDFGSM